MESTIFQAAPNDHGRRLDRILRKLLKGESLSYIYKSFREKKILVNGKPVAPDYHCQRGDIIKILIPIKGKLQAIEQEDDQRREKMDMLANIILRDTPDLLILNKPRGMLAHDGKNSLDALVQACYYHSHSEQSIVFKPGPLHRLDRNTSGIITFSQSIEGARQFSAGMQRGSIKKTYLAILDGSLTTPESWTDALARDKNQKITFSTKSFLNTALKSARTDVWPLAYFGGFTFAAIQLFSGRTHQIRTHASIHGHPLSGDRKYGSHTHLQGYFLHAWMLDLQTIELFSNLGLVQAPLPKDFLLFLYKQLCLSEKEVYSLLQSFQEQGGVNAKHCF